MHEVDEWFMREVLPLEPALMGLLRRSGYSESEQVDLRQELYVQLYESARKGLPRHTRAFAFRALRNLLINQVRRARVVSMESIADLDALSAAVDVLTPEREATAREELRRLKAGLERLPPRCRKVVMLRRIEGLSQREVAERLGVKVSTVEKQMAYGLRALTDFMLGGAGRIRRDADAASPSDEAML
ncbi:RNA polymerase sigma factor [Luteimonas aquatica]|uniref:RNA polymerase sigma factor n=1 Tax=Luteimonas aquatica TaxID=450364 RepID=UPI001F55F8F8|nr:sigma-70 family RNA polymerase sigma factor [Luteimonas aquatica]